MTYREYETVNVLGGQPHNFFGNPNIPIGGSGFTLKSSPFGGASDSNVGPDTVMTVTGQPYDSSSGAKMSNYRLKLGELARRHQPKRKASQLSALGGETIGEGIAKSIFDTKSKKRRTDQTIFQDVHFADGKTTISTSLGSFGFSMENLTDEREMTTTSGFHSNGSIPGEQMVVVPIDEAIAPGEYDIVITAKRPFMGGYEDETLKNMGIKNTRAHVQSNYNVFQSNSSSSQPLWPALNQMGGFSSASRRGFTIAAFNYWIATHQTYSTSGTRYTDDLIRQKEMMKHFRFLEEFLVQGIADSEMYANGQSSFGRSNDENTNISSFSPMNDKKLNIIYEGLAKQKNIWGPVTAGVTLWLIWKKIKRPDSYIIGSVGPGPVVSSSLPTVSVNGQNTSTMPFQLVPYASPDHGEPPLSELYYESDHVHSPDGPKRKHVGVCFYIGQMCKPQDTSIAHDGGDKIKRTQMQKKAVYDCTTGSDDLVEILVMPRHGKPGRIQKPEIFPITRSNKLLFTPATIKLIKTSDIKNG